MAKRISLRTNLAVAIVFTLVLALGGPALQNPADAQSRTTLVSKVSVNSQLNGGQVTLASGLGGTPATSLKANQGKFVLKVTSKSVSTIDKIAVAYSCYSNGQLTSQKFKELRPVEGITLPAKLSLTLKSPSETCYITGAIDAPWDGQPRGKLTMTLKTVTKK